MTDLAEIDAPARAACRAEQATECHRCGRVLAFVRSYREEHGISPSFREIASACGIPIGNALRYHLSGLEARGEISILYGVGRSIRPL